MTQLSKLVGAKHQSLRVAPNCAVELAARQHVINLRAPEVGKAITSFPVFFSRNSHTGDWALTAIASLEVGHNLFVENKQWTATYQPSGMRTYPFYLMKSDDDEKGYAVGIDEQSDAFSEHNGDQLFGDDGQPTPYLSQVTALLEADIQNDMQTHHFLKKLDEMGLYKSIDILVQYDGGAVSTLTGLHTLDEDKLQSLSAEQLEELNQRGYLAIIYASLISIFQLNSLVTKHNQLAQFKPVKQVKLEVAKAASNVA